MKTDREFGIMVLFELVSLAAVVLVMVFLPEDRVAAYRLWEVFPAILAALITTFGIKEMRRKT
jgi:hypothetical protein